LKGSGKYDNKIDNWSLGVILYICLVGYPPFSDEDKKNSLEEQIKKGLYDFPDEYWSNVSSIYLSNLNLLYLMKIKKLFLNNKDDAKDVVKRLMCVDSAKRATLEEILEHKWIKNDIEMKTKVKLMMEKEMEKYEIVNSNNNNHSKKRDDFDEKEKIFSPKKTRSS
jgi:serine/threonine-protein kinase Chk2